MDVSGVWKDVLTSHQIEYCNHVFEKKTTNSRWGQVQGNVDLRFGNGFLWMAPEVIQCKACLGLGKTSCYLHFLLMASFVLRASSQSSQKVQESGRRERDAKGAVLGRIRRELV